jgi:hypothetical protein
VGFDLEVLLGGGVGDRLPRSVVHEMLTGKSPLTPRNVNIYLTACGMTGAELRRWIEVFYRVRQRETQLTAVRDALRDQQTGRALEVIEVLAGGSGVPAENLIRPDEDRCTGCPTRLQVLPRGCSRTW